MKKYLLSMSVLAMAMTFASCSKDDDPVNLADTAKGDYSGYTVASCAYFSDMVSDGEEVKITSSEVDKANISFASDTWGTFTVSGAALTGSADNIKISGSGVTAMAHAGSETQEYACTVSGTIVNKELALTFSVPSVMGGLTVEFKQGDAPTE